MPLAGLVRWAYRFPKLSTPKITATTDIQNIIAPIDHRVFGVIPSRRRRARITRPAMTPPARAPANRIPFCTQGSSITLTLRCNADLRQHGSQNRAAAPHMGQLIVIQLRIAQIDQVEVEPVDSRSAQVGAT
jgi:hypothetical protein